MWPAAVLIFLIGTKSNAGPATLDSLIQVALKHNSGLVAAQSRYQSMQHEAGAAGALPDPNFNISLMNMPRTTLSLREMDMSGVSLGASQMIPWPGMLAAKSRVAKLGAEVEAADVKSLENSIVRQIKHFYYEYSYWSFAENLLNENIELSGQIIEYIETRYGNGNGSIEEVVSARVSEKELENEKIALNAKKRAALYMIFQLVNDTSMVDTALVPFLTVKLEDTLNFLPDYSQNPMLMGAATKYEVARARHSLAKSEYWPEFMIGASYLIRVDDSAKAMAGGLVPPGEDLLSFHFGFSLPLWFFSKQNKMTTAAKYGMKSAKAQERSVDIELKQSIREAQVELKSLKERIDHYIGSIIPLSEAAYNSAHVAYEVGRIDFQKLLQDQITVYNSKLEHLKLIKESHQTRAYLDELIGHEYGE